MILTGFRLPPGGPIRHQSSLRVWSLSLLFMLLLSPAHPKSSPMGLQAEPPGSLRITRIDASAFPDVGVNLVARAGDGRPLEELDRTQLRLTEDGIEVPIELVGRVTCGVRVVFVADVGDGALNTGVHLAEVVQIARRHVSEFVAGGPWMDPTVDEVSVLVQEGEATREVVGFTSSPESIEAAFASYVPPGDAGFARAGEYGEWTHEALSEALDAIEFSPDASGKLAHVVLFTPGVRADLADIAERALRLDVPIHVHLSRRTATTYWEEALTPLALVTHGRPSAELEDDDLGDLFHEVTQARQQSRLVYRSTSAGQGTRAVLLESGGVQVRAAYDVALSPPRVFLEPPSTSVERSGRRGPQGWEGDPSSVPIPFRVEWPDGYPRRIAVSQLLVEDVPVSEGQVSEEGGSFLWDVRDYTSWAPAQVVLRGEVRDELGLRAVSPPVTLAVSLRPAGLLTGAAGWLAYAAIGLSIAALAASVSLFVSRRRWLPAMHEAGDRVVDFIERVTGRRAAPSVRARLVPLQGFESPQPPAFDLYGTTAVGRSRRHADLLFHIEDENSPISRLHCTLLDEDDHFRLRDEASSNGTFLNGERLAELEPRELQEGDVIDLAPLERGGLRFRFQCAGDGRAEPEPAEDLRLTRPRASGLFDAESPEELEAQDGRTGGSTPV